MISLWEFEDGQLHLRTDRKAGFRMLDSGQHVEVRADGKHFYIPTRLLQEFLDHHKAENQKAITGVD